MRRPSVELVVSVALAALSIWMSGPIAQEGAPVADGADVSRFVYPGSGAALRFDHGKHGDVECAACHQAAATSRSARDDLTPPMTACAGCHSGSAEPRLEKCGGCHDGFRAEALERVTTPEQWRAVRPAPMTAPRPPTNIRFSHASHAARMACGTCHEAQGAGVSMPSMAQCTSCHTSVGGPTDCASCHPTGDGGRLSTGDGEFSLRPDNHGVDFTRRHPSVARSDPGSCGTCHAEEDCATCHVANLSEPAKFHPPNFVAIHARDSRGGAGTCADCHSGESFCTSCHARANVTTVPGHAPPPRRRVHPPGWLDRSVAGNHGVMARRDITECTTCHTESDCITCHVGVNPHPPDFRVRCGSMLAANAGSCGRCHADVSGLRSLCL